MAAEIAVIKLISLFRSVRPRTSMCCTSILGGRSVTECQDLILKDYWSKSSVIYITNNWFLKKIISRPIVGSFLKNCHGISINCHPCSPQVSKKCWMWPQSWMKFRTRGKKIPRSCWITLASPRPFVTISDVLYFYGEVC